MENAKDNAFVTLFILFCISFGFFLGWNCKPYLSSKPEPFPLYKSRILTRADSSMITTSRDGRTTMIVTRFYSIEK